MRKGCAILTVLLVGAVTAEGDAQRHQSASRLDSLARVAARTRAAVRAWDDSVRRVARVIDTAYAGTPVVVAEREISARTRAIAPIVVDSVASVVGPALSRLAGYSFRVRIQRRAGWSGARDTTKELVVSIVGPNDAEMRAWRAPVDSASIAQSLHHAMMHAAFAAADAAFLAWAGNAIPNDTLRASEWANQRLLLVSAQSAVGGRCYAGDRKACRIALLLTPGSDPVLDWHDSMTRRRLVRRHGAMARRMDSRAERQCLAGSDDACIELLQLFPSAAFREPAALGLRLGFLRHALAVGGTGAVARLLTASTASPTERLAAAAGVPIDSLIGSWQARVRETRAPSEDLTFGITIMSLAWVAGIGALSLRSSRWR